ncbi:hypothetical protein [Acinetobacter pseudolwoffii]|uniref:hypothetical protein n=1 Tax=Acinetobacter pseudolwoffii TaxID=2053287 RepID=UPI0012FE0B46|nr:hypothetical protein [Acinetobacter pseudolwoffii]
MGDFLIFIGLIISIVGTFIGPHVLREKVNNYMDAKAASFLGMLPGILVMFIASFFK